MGVDGQRGRAERRRRVAQVAALEEAARRAPAAYRRRVLLLALFGQGVLALAALVGLGLPLLALAGLAIHGFTLELQDTIGLLLMFGLGVMMARALWLPVAPPPGHALRPEDAPALAEDIERLRVAAGAPPLDGVVLDADLNAAAATCPRAFGLLGERRYLVIGLPLLQLLDREQLLAVIAHEFGHFRSERGRFMAWIYRLRLRWLRIADSSASGMTMSSLLLRFFVWYAPRFDMTSFVLAREEEYAADAMACRLVGADALVSGLLRLEHASAWLEKRLWQPMPARMRAQPSPPLSICAEQARWLRERPQADPARVLAASVCEHDADDTHPALARRVAAAGVATGVASDLRRDAPPAAALIDPAVLAEAERTVDAQWRERLRRPWAEAHAAAASERQRLEALERNPDLETAERLQHAHLAETLRPERDPRRIYAQLLEDLPDDASVLFRLGVLQVDDDDPAGVALLERALRLDIGAVGPAFDRLDAWDRDPTLSAATLAGLQRLRAAYAVQAESLRAREGVDEDDALEPHGLDPAALDPLRRVLAGTAPVAEAWLACKRLPLPGEPPHYILLLRWRGSMASETAGLKRLAAALSLPGSLTVIGDGDSSQRTYAARVRAVCPVPVYRRG